MIWPETRFITAYCLTSVGGDPAAPGAPAAVELPAIPQPEEVLAVELLPDVPVLTSPEVRGLTGLENWFWSDPVAPVTVSPSIRGYALTATASPVRFRWFVGDQLVAEAEAPGSEAAPAGEHVFTHVGTYELRLEVDWTGSYTVSGNGLPPLTLPLGTVTTTSTRAYEVTEAQALIVR